MYKDSHDYKVYIIIIQGDRVKSGVRYVQKDECEKEEKVLGEGKDTP